MLAVGQQLGQSRPGVITPVSLFTATLRTEVALIVVTNTSDVVAEFSIFHDDDGAVFDESTALHYRQSIPPTESIYVGAEFVGGGFMISQGGQIGVQSGTVDALTFTAYGFTQQVTA